MSFWRLLETAGDEKDPIVHKELRWCTSHDGENKMYI